MYDVEGLEKEWKRYKNKQRIPWAVAFMVLVLLVMYMLFRSDFSTLFSGQPDNNTSKKAEETPEPKKHTKLQAYVPTLLPGEESNQSLQDVDHAEKKEVSEQNSTKEESRPPISIEVSEPKEVPPEKHRKKYIKIELTDMYPDSQKEQKASNTKKGKLSIKRVEKNFSKSRSYRDSLYLAQAYYRTGDYAKAQMWALITNDLNSKLEESWLIFAKSKAKMGQRKDAEQVLGSYIKKTNSPKARALLVKIKKGKI